MIWISIAVAYFVGACTLAALLLLPSFRERLAHHALLWARRTALARESTWRFVVQRAQRGGVRTNVAAGWLRRRLGVSSIALALLAAPPLLVYSLREMHTLAAFDDTSASTADGVVAALLEGEQLVPPPPLPPEVFTTPDVELVRPRLGSADRRWEALDVDFRQRLLLAYKIMREEHGYEMVLIEGYRSPERQNVLAALGPQVTHAVAWQSYHQHGLAADSAFVRDGTLVISERDPWAAGGYALFGQVAQRVGLTWGGRWRIADLGHVELRKSIATRPKVGD